ncbi:hypothetical protein ACIA49_33460 [Kribbella sp. NPDC051587]|uniref:hypothetical protein n=1 Tax=Kribbella sp. NPDC051587 TaxID=3364119 RepID=UPI00378969C0
MKGDSSIGLQTAVESQITAGELALAALVSGLLALGRFTDALDLIESINDPEDLASALAECSVHATAAEGLQLLVRAFCADGSEPPLDALGALNREVLTAIGDELDQELDAMLAERAKPRQGGL